MKALVSREPGLPASLRYEEVGDPEPGAGEVVLRMAACAVNFPDLLMIQDRYQVRPPRPFSPGAEVAGTIERVGAGVRELAVGDRVMAICNWGGMAELVAIPASRCLPLPTAMPFADAAALQITYGTAHYALTRRGRVSAGDAVLVLGAGGGVGSAAVELAKALGADVTAAVSSEAKAGFAQRAGADEVLVYPAGPFDDAGRGELAGYFKQSLTRRPDIIVDPVGGPYSEAALRSIAWGGRLLVVGFAAGIPRIPLNLVLLKGAEIVPVPFGAVVERDPHEWRAVTAELTQLYQDGAIRPHIWKVLPLSRGAEAIAALDRREALGKMIIVPDAAWSEWPA